jgi:hypothetical protein
MKTLKVEAFFLLFVLFLSATLTAQPLLKLEEGRVNDLLTVRLTDLDRQYANVSVNDLNGKTWLQKKLWKRDEYTAGFDLGPLPDGDYLMTVHSRGARIVQPFTKEGADIALLQPKPVQETMPAARPVVNRKPDRTGQLIARIDQPAGKRALDLQLANLRGQPVQVGLLSTAGIPAFTDRVSGKQGYAHRINLTGLAPGEYILYIRSAEVSIMQFLEVDKGGVELQHALSREPRAGDSVLIAGR